MPRLFLGKESDSDFVLLDLPVTVDVYFVIAVKILKESIELNGEWVGW